MFPERQYAVGIQQIRLEPVDHLINALQPVVPELFIPCIPRVKVLPCSVFLVCVIEILISRIIAVIGHTCIGSGLVAAFVHPPPGKGCPQVFTDAEGQVVLVRRSLPQGQDILPRSNVHTVHAVDFGVIVKEMVMMHCLGHQVPGPGLVVFCHQCVRIKLLRLPQGADILIPEFGRMPVMPQVVFILRLSLDIHIPGIPVPEHRYALGTPVAPDSEFGIPEPFRRGILPQ